MAKVKVASAHPTTAQSLGSLIKSARDIMRRRQGAEWRSGSVADADLDHVFEVSR